LIPHWDFSGAVVLTFLVYGDLWSFMESHITINVRPTTLFMLDAISFPAFVSQVVKHVQEATHISLVLFEAPVRPVYNTGVFGSVRLCQVPRPSWQPKVNAYCDFCIKHQRLSCSIMVVSKLVSKCQKTMILPSCGCGYA
jgi:hypothetical protein